MTASAANLPRLLSAAHSAPIFERKTSALSNNASLSKVTILDGSMGDYLRVCGVPDDDLFKQIWSSRSLVDESLHCMIIDAHQKYIHAGARILTTNSYSIQPSYYRTAFPDDWQAKMVQHAELAARLAVRARGESGVSGVRIIGTMGPVKESHRPDLFASFLEQEGEAFVLEAYSMVAAALVRGGVDGLLCETMNCWEEASLALRGCESLGLPITVSFEGSLRDLALQPQPQKAPGLAQRVLEEKRRGVPLEALGFNCSTPEDILACLKALDLAGLIEELRLEGLQIACYGNCNDGEQVWKNGFDVQQTSNSPNTTLRGDLCDDGFRGYMCVAQQWVAHGATRVGGCCGCTPEGIKRISAHFSSHGSSYRSCLVVGGTEGACDYVADGEAWDRTLDTLVDGMSKGYGEVAAHQRRNQNAFYWKFVLDGGSLQRACDDAAKQQRPLHFAEFGVADGQNSGPMWSDICKRNTDQVGMDRALTRLSAVDLPRNKWDVVRKVVGADPLLFELCVDEAIDMKSCESGSILEGVGAVDGPPVMPISSGVSLVGRSFFDRCLHTNSVDLAFTTGSMHWLSPEQVQTLPVLPYQVGFCGGGYQGQRALFRRDSHRAFKSKDFAAGFGHALPFEQECKLEEQRRVWYQASIADGKKFVSHRLDELRVGGRLLMSACGYDDGARFGLNGDCAECHWIFSCVSKAIAQLVEQGHLAEGDAAKACHIPLYWRSTADVLEILDDAVQEDRCEILTTEVHGLVCPSYIQLVADLLSAGLIDAKEDLLDDWPRTQAARGHVPNGAKGFPLNQIEAQEYDERPFQIVMPDDGSVPAQQPVGWANTTSFSSAKRSQQLPTFLWGPRFSANYHAKVTDLEHQRAMGTAPEPYKNAIEKFADWQVRWVETCLSEMITKNLSDAAEGGRNKEPKAIVNRLMEELGRQVRADPHGKMHPGSVVTFVVLEKK